MVGKGYKSSEEEDEMDQRPRDIYDGSESDTQSDDEDDSDTKSNPDSDNSKYADFQQLYNQNERVAAAKGEEMTVDERRKHFRDKILCVTATYFALKKEPTFKKIMETVRDLKSGAGGYDMSEALERGFEQRRHLLDRVYDYLEEQAEGSEDEESGNEDSDSDDAEDVNVSYGVAK